MVDSVHAYEARDSMGSAGRRSTGRASIDLRGSMQRGSVERRSSVGGYNRGSLDSQAGGSGPGSVRSARSSFALEVGAPEPPAAAGLTSLPQLPPQLMLQGSLFLQQLPQELHVFYKLLAVLPVGNPVPLTMLQRLWGCSSYGEAEHVAQALAALGILRVAELDDLTVWCLPGPDHVHFLAAVQEKQLEVGSSAAAERWSAACSGSCCHTHCSHAHMRDTSFCRVPECSVTAVAQRAVDSCSEVAWHWRAYPLSC